MCFFKLEFKPGVGGGFLRAFTSQKGPGKGLPASGFAPERRESPEFPGGGRRASGETTARREDSSGGRRPAAMAMGYGPYGNLHMHGSKGMS